MDKNPETLSYADVAAVQTLFKVDLRPYFNFYEAPDGNVVGAAVRAVFPDDPALIVKPMTGRMEGCYRIAATTPPKCKQLQFTRTKIVGEGLETVAIPLQDHDGQGGARKDGTLVTIVDGDLGTAHRIPNQMFNQVMAAYGDVVMATKPQTDKSTNMFNGNRMCVVDTKNSTNKLPNRIIVNNESFLIKYRGKTWFCSNCQVEHTGACSYLKEFYEALNKNKDMEIQNLIISDSTLRLVENVGLKADISCMSGATIGQLATALEQNPNLHKYKNVVVAAGCNDITVKDMCDYESVAKKIDFSLHRLAEVGIRQKDKIKLSFLNTSPYTLEQTPIEEFSSAYLREVSSDILTKFGITALTPPTYSDEWSNGHPTETGTKELLNSVIPVMEDLVINENFTTTDKLYRGVETLWVSGCSGCRTRGRFPQNHFCADCIDKMNGCDVQNEAAFIKFKEASGTFSSDADRKRRLASESSSDDCHHGKQQVMD